MEDFELRLRVSLGPVVEQSPFLQRSVIRAVVDLGGKPPSEYSVVFSDPGQGRVAVDEVVTAALAQVDRELREWMA